VTPLCEGREPVEELDLRGRGFGLRAAVLDIGGGVGGGGGWCDAAAGVSSVGGLLPMVVAVSMD
jgi:hypothetical protein